MDGSAEAEAQNWVALLRGDLPQRDAAVGQLYRRYGGAFVRYFRRHRATEAQAEDMLQEVFIKMLRAIDGYAGTGSFEAWLWSIARSTLISSTRRADPDCVSLDALDSATAEALVSAGAGRAADPAARDCIGRAFAEFARRYGESAEVLTRVVVDGWGYEELATFRGSSAGAAREFLSQCRKRLTVFIQPCLDLIEGRGP